MARTVEIVYPVCCGMDVHKSFVVACIAVTDEHSHTAHHIKRFSTFTGDLRRMADWLASYLAGTFAWNRQENTGFRYSIYSKRPAMFA